MKTLLSLLLIGCMVGFVVADDKKDEKKAEFDAKKLEGTWSLVSGMKAGSKTEGDALKVEFIVKGDVMTMKSPQGDFVFKLKIEATKTPVEVDLEITDGPIGKGSTAKGILELKDDVLKLCYNPDGSGDRPGKLDGEKNHLFELKKKKADK